MILGIVQLVVGVVGLCLAPMAFGDIGIALGFGAIASVLSGIGFIGMSRKIKKLTK